MKTAGVILAGGASTRMGSPKALLRFENRTFLERLTAAFATCCDPVVVVLGHGADAIRPHLPSGVIPALNAQPERGQLSSLQCGLAALPGEVDAAAFCPVDFPLVHPETVALLVESLQGHSLAIPVFGGRHGHPVLVRRELFAEFLAAEGSAREVIHAHREQTRFVSVTDPGVLRDIDTPAEYRSLEGGAA